MSYNVDPGSTGENGEFEDIPLLSEDDIAYLSHVLGFEGEYLRGLDDIPDNEYGWLMSDAFNLRDDLRDRMADIAHAMGEGVSKETQASWEPAAAELDLLYQQAGRLRRRLRMVQGMVQFAEDSMQLAEQQGVSLRPHQRVGFAKVTDFILNGKRNDHGGKSGVVLQPTGYGKTALLAKAAAQMKHAEDPDDPVGIMIIAPNQILVNQTEGQGGVRGLEKFAPHLDVGTYFQHNKDLSKKVTITTIDSLIRLYRNGQLPDADAYIVDELHMMLADTIGGQVLEEVTKDKVLMGFTATDRYNDHRTVYSVVDHKIDEVPFRQAVEDGYLSPIVGRLLTAEPRIDPLALSSDPATARREVRAARLKARIETSIPIIQKAVEDGLGVVVRCPAGQDIDVAVTLAEVLKEHYVGDEINLRMIRADYVGGSMQDFDEREAILDDFDKGGVDVLTYVKALGLGWDSIHGKVLINLASSSSSVEIRQAVGRISRLSVAMDENNNPTAIIAYAYDFVDPAIPHQYTVLDALGSKHGELITHRTDGESSAPIPQPSYLTAVVPEFTTIDSEEIDERSIQHAADVKLPDSAQIHQMVAAMRRPNISPAEVGRTLGLGQKALRHLLRSAGFDPYADVPVSEVAALAEQSILGGNIPKLPQDMSTVISFGDLNAQFDRPVRMYSLIPFARDQGFTPLRFVDKYGSIGYYFKVEDAWELLQLVNSGKHRLTYAKEIEQND